MKQETAEVLIASILQATRTAMDAHMKIIAFEKTLEQDAPNLFVSYQKNFQKVLENPPFSFDLGGIANLQSKLVQD